MMHNGFLPAIDITQFAAKINKHPIRQRRPSCALHMEAGHALADPATLTSHPRSSTHPSAAPTAAPDRATPTYGAAGFSAKGTA